MHTIHCDHPTCHEHEPPRAHHDNDCREELAELRRLDDLRRGQRDELRRKALVAYKLFFDPHACPVALCKAMVEMRDATDFDR